MPDSNSTTAAINAALSSRPVTVAALLIALGALTTAIFQPLGGDLTGSMPNPVVAKINGVAPGPFATATTVPASAVTALPSGLIKGFSGMFATAVPSDVTTALGYSPLNKAGDTMTGALGLIAPASTDTSNAAVTSAWVKQFFPSLSASVEGLGPGLDMGGCASASACEFWLYGAPSAYPAANASTLRVDKSAPATGGVSGNTYSALEVNDTTGLNDAGFQWANKTQLYNRTAVASLAQNVALSSTVFDQLNGLPSGSNVTPAWAGYFEHQDQTGTPNPSSGKIGLEVDTYAAVGGGSDNFAQRTGLQVVGGVYNGPDANVHIGQLILLGTANLAVADSAIKLGGGTFGIGINLGSGIFQTAGVLLSAAAQQPIGWSDTSATPLFDATHGLSMAVANDNNFYLDAKSDQTISFRGQNGDARMSLTSALVTISKPTSFTSSVNFGGVGYFANGIASTGGSIQTGGSNGGFFANDRSGTGSAGFYRASGVNSLYDSTFGNVITYTATLTTLAQPVTLSSTLAAPSLPTSGGSGGLYACVDSSGNFYKKASCP